MFFEHLNSLRSILNLREIAVSRSLTGSNKNNAFLEIAHS